jgi:hypothetical protein
MLPGPKAPSREGVDAKADVDDVPVLREIDRHIARSDYAAAVLAAFPLVMKDVERAFGTPFPSHWTARDVLAHGLRSDVGNLPTLLFQLYTLYEPIRFGRESDWVQGDVREIVRRIYTDTVLGRRRVIAPTWEVPPPPFARARTESPPTSREVSGW